MKRTQLVGKSVNKYEFELSSDAEHSLTLIRSLLESQFDLRNENGSIVAEGHIMITIPKCGKNIVFSIEPCK